MKSRGPAAGQCADPHLLQEANASSRQYHLRPGDFTAADIAMYVLVMGHIGPELMAVTSDMTMHFLNKGAPGDLIAEARMLKLGRRLAVMDVLVYSALIHGR